MVGSGLRAGVSGEYRDRGKFGENDPFEAPFEGQGKHGQQARVFIGTSRLPSKLPSGLRVNGVNSVNTSGLSVNKHDGG
jgi:hypothetical protein